MFHLTLFSSAETSLASRGHTTLTVFGSSVLHAPTLAQRVLRLARPARPPSTWDMILGRHRSMMVTVFGSTEVALPSLLDEWTAMRQLASGHEIPREQLRALCEQLATRDPQGLDLATLTLFGTCRVARPAPKREQAAFERAEKGGVIDRPIRAVLESLVGRGEPAVIGGLTQAALT
ncbi:MAG: hypothetical protein R3F56_07110 [Planctomycetota bacterium]